GLLLTNNHVLGTAICPIEGCYAQITFDYQRGMKPQTPQTVFVVPTAVSIGLDMAVVQAYTTAGGSELATPSFLTIQSESVASLMKTHVTLVGHPEGHLKKWTAGEVVDSDGDWVYTTAYLLPGNSGSPMLDDAGQIVGIVHRGPTGEDYFTSEGVVTFSIGTPSALLLAAMQASAPIPPEMVSVAAANTQVDVVTNDLVYLNARVPTANISGGGTLSVLSALGTACDAALAASYATPDDLTAALQPCDDGLSWIECRAEEIASSPGSVCPDAADSALWQQRFTQMNAVTVAMNGQTFLYPVSFGFQSLSATDAAGLTAGAAGLVQALNGAAQPLDLGVANYLAAFAVPSYLGVSTASYVTGYTSVPDYALDASDAVSAAMWLVANQVLTSTQGFTVVEQLYADPTVDINTKLYAEDVEYQAGVLQ
ncbi:MAG: trypsin-like serine peptidase, partial [Polyangiaceae bacterium]